MSLVSSAKRAILKTLEHVGYVVLKKDEYEQRQQSAEAEKRAVSALRVERDGLLQEISRARAEVATDTTTLAQMTGENEELRQKLGEMQNCLGADRDQFVEATAEIRRLRAELAGMPQIDYQVWMDHQAKSVTFKAADPRFHALYEQVRACSMTSIERLYAMHNATQYIVKSRIPGDIVECGVWRGGSMMMAALTALALHDTSRGLVLFDTFEGLPKPDPEKDGRDNYEEWARRSRSDRSSDWAYAPLEEVRQNMETTGYPMDRVVFVKGLVQQTIPSNLPKAIALLRLDTDWYESTVYELRYLYPRLSDFGILIVDDYGSLAGQRRAIDEFFPEDRGGLLFNRIDHSGRLAIKMPQPAV